jgi:hypothetical protein
MKKVRSSASGKHLAFCPQGHGAMYWIEQSGKYYCSSQEHDVSGAAAFFTEAQSEGLRRNTTKRHMAGEVAPAIPAD